MLEVAEDDAAELVLELKLAKVVIDVAEDEDTSMLELVSAVLAEDIELVGRLVELSVGVTDDRTLLLDKLAPNVVLVDEDMLVLLGEDDISEDEDTVENSVDDNTDVAADVDPTEAAGLIAKRWNKDMNLAPPQVSAEFPGHGVLHAASEVCVPPE